MAERKVEISQATSGVTAKDGAGATWNADNWDLKVEINQSYKLQPGDTFSCYLVGDDTAEMPDKTRIRVVKRDLSNLLAKPLLDECLYARCKAFADKKKILRLNITQPVLLEAGEHLVVLVNGMDKAGTGDLAVAASSFKITALWRGRSLS